MRARSIAPTVARQPILAFVLLAYLFTWSISIPLALADQGALPFDPPFPLHYLSSFGPMAAALLTAGLTGGRAGLRDIGRRVVRWRVGAAWWLVALAPVVLFAAAAAIERLLRGAWPSLHAIGQVNFLPYLGLAAVPLWIVTSGFGEELGWRGYLLPALQRRHGALQATLLIWLVWTGWHLPYFFYLPGYQQMGLIGIPELAFSLLAGAILLTWLHNGSGGSLLLVILWHGLFNVFTASEAGQGMVAMAISMPVIAAALAILALARPSDLAGRREPKPSTHRPRPLGNQRGGQEHDHQVEQEIQAGEDAGDDLQPAALGGQLRIVAVESAGALGQGGHASPEITRVN
ncbi:MAG TPA: type II CAAX endopeptidase family protein [Thermomicrobiaceae bacterium]|nr:type II CAAX endopeptidase family protein [Thermomicrobiaceae bacterium]